MNQLNTTRNIQIYLKKYYKKHPDLSKKNCD